MREGVGSRERKRGGEEVVNSSGRTSITEGDD